MTATLNLASAFFALVAAGLWWWSAAVPWPDLIVFDGGGFDENDLLPEKNALQKMSESISIRNRLAAGTAGLSAFFSATANVYSTIWPLS